jgi:hypothetical protein
MLAASIFLIFVFFIGQSYQINNGLGKTPQMGKIQIIDLTKAIMNQTFF